MTQDELNELFGLSKLDKLRVNYIYNGGGHEVIYVGYYPMLSSINICLN